MTEFRFAYPLVFLIVALPVAIYTISVLKGWRPRSGFLLYSDLRLMSTLPGGWRVRWRWLPDMLRWAAWLVIVVALARPQTGRAQEVVRGEGIDIVLALDISSSMAALDFEPSSRLEVAKSVIADFISQREFDRIGLVVFARNAFQQAPPTLDYPMLLRLLDRIAPVSDIDQAGLRRMDGTAIGLGLASSANMLRASTATSKVIVLLTDGDNNAGIDPVYMAEAIARLGMRIYVIGMGSPGQSDLNEDLLREIAVVGDGLYFRAGDMGELQQIYTRINTLERSTVEKIVFVRWQDRAAPWLITAMVLLVVERVLRRTAFQVIP